VRWTPCSVLWRCRVNHRRTLVTEERCQVSFFVQLRFIVWVVEPAGKRRGRKKAGQRDDAQLQDSTPPVPSSESSMRRSRRVASCRASQPSLWRAARTAEEVWWCSQSIGKASSSRAASLCCYGPPRRNGRRRGEPLRCCDLFSSDVWFWW
jgi:hypothetical protein